MLEGFVNFLSAIGSPTFNQQQRLSKLRQQLMSCTYYNNIKYVIEKICMDVMRTYPSLETNILAFIENNQPRRFIEIGGILTYNYKNKKQTVKVFMMFNQYFPNKPPYVRVVNYQHKSVSRYYEIYQSPNDNSSYVLNSKLLNLAGWAPGKSCLPVFQQLKFLLEKDSFYQEDTIEQKKQQNLYQQQKKLEKPQNQYVANRGSYYQTNIKEEKPQQKGTEGQDYDMKQCKLCFNNQSSMINLNCGHIMMCQDCYLAYRKKYGSDVCQCPICKTKGQYIRFIQPKYA